MSKLILSVILWFIIALVVAGVATLFAPINFRAWFWSVFLVGFIGDWLIFGIVILGKRESQLPW